MMKRIFNYLILFIFPAFFMHLYAQSETFILDNQHSYVLWTIKHMGFSSQTGKWYVNGELTVNKDHPELSQVKATININDLTTGLAELDKHLKSSMFFDVEQFPKATFVSNKVKVLTKNSAQVEGMLTVHGITKPVTLDVTLNKSGINPINHKNTLGFSASTTIKRSDFGMNALLPDLGDEVFIQIGAEAYQDNKVDHAS